MKYFKLSLVCLLLIGLSGAVSEDPRADRANEIRENATLTLPALKSKDSRFNGTALLIVDGSGRTLNRGRSYIPSTSKHGLPDR